MLTVRRILSAVCYTANLAADIALAYVIYISFNGAITYYLGMLIFIPGFIFSWWMSVFFSQLSYGKENGRRIMPKRLRSFLNLISGIASLVLIAFWGYIYITQQINGASNEDLVTQTRLLRLL